MTKAKKMTNWKNFYKQKPVEGQKVILYDRKFSLYITATFCFYEDDGYIWRKSDGEFLDISEYPDWLAQDSLGIPEETKRGVIEVGSSLTYNGGFATTRELRHVVRIHGLNGELELGNDFGNEEAALNYAEKWFRFLNFPIKHLGRVKEWDDYPRG